MAEIKYKYNNTWTTVTAADIGAATASETTTYLGMIGGCYLYAGTVIKNPSSSKEATIWLESEFESTFHVKSGEGQYCGVIFSNGHYEAANLGPVGAEFRPSSNTYYGGHARGKTSRTGSTRLQYLVIVPASSHDGSNDNYEPTANLSYKDNNIGTNLTANDIDAGSEEDISIMQTQLNGNYIYVGTLVKNVGSSNTTEATLFLNSQLQSNFHCTGDNMSATYCFITNGDRGASGTNFGPVNAERGESGTYAGGHARGNNNTTGNKRFNYIIIVPESQHDSSSDTTVSTTHKLQYYSPYTDGGGNYYEGNSLTPRFFHAGTAENLQTIKNQLYGVYSSAAAEGVYIYSGTVGVTVSKNATTVRVGTDSTFASTFHVNSSSRGYVSVIFSNGDGSATGSASGTSDGGGPVSADHVSNDGGYAKGTTANPTAGGKRINYIVIVANQYHAS